VKRRDVRLHRGGRYLVRLGEDEDERDGVAGEPGHDSTSIFLRWQPGVEQRKDTAKARSMLKVIVHRMVELEFGLTRPGGEIHIPADPPDAKVLFIVKNVDELVNPRRGRDPGQIQLPESRFSKEDLPTLGPADEGEFRQRLIRTRVQVRRATIKNGG